MAEIRITPLDYGVVTSSEVTVATGEQITLEITMQLFPRSEEELDIITEALVSNIEKYRGGL